MKVNRNIESRVFRGEDGSVLRVHYDNRGEPFREGVSLDLEDGYDHLVGVFLDAREAEDLRRFLNELLGDKG